MRYRIPVALVLAAAPALASPQEYSGAWALSLDNDWFAPSRTDRDYTAGLAFTYSSPAIEREWNLLGRLLQSVNRALIGLDDRNPRGLSSALEFGLYGFTPEDLSQSGIIQDDRPYSSLAYLSSSRSYPDEGSRNGWTTTLTIGMLGLSLFEQSQNAIHPLVGSETAEGWNHQISDGGEPTFRYGAAYHDYLDATRPDSQFKLTYFGSIGYLTEAGIAFVFRDGLISSPSNRFNPELSIYGELGPMSSLGGARESYLWGGVAIKFRLYNAFLEGQSRDSDHEIGRNDLRYWLGEAWLGYTHSFLEHYKISYFLRLQSSEIKDGPGDRNLFWGGLVLSRSF